MSLLERLCHEADELPYQPCTERAVTAHLYRIINARAPVWAGGRKSSGIAGFGQSHLLRAQGKFHLTAITQEIESLIRCYEPRLQRVSVTIVPHSYRQHGQLPPARLRRLPDTVIAEKTGLPAEIQ